MVHVPAASELPGSLPKRKANEKKNFGSHPKLPNANQQFHKFPSCKPIKVGQASLSAIPPWIYQTSLIIKFASSFGERISVCYFSMWVYIVLIPHIGLVDAEIISKLRGSYISSGMIPFPGTLTFATIKLKQSTLTQLRTWRRTWDRTWCPFTSSQLLAQFSHKLCLWSAYCWSFVYLSAFCPCS